MLSNTKSVILGSQSTIKSIIVPSTNMGYLCSLKNPKLLYILRHSSVTWSYSKLQQSHIKGFASFSSLHIALFKSSTIAHLTVCKHVFIADSLIQNLHTLTVCKHVFIADSLIQNLHTLTHKRFASMSSLQIALFKTYTHSHIKGLQACLHCTERYLNQCM